MRTHHQTLSPWKAVEYFLLITLVLIVVGMSGYWLSYWATYQEGTEGSALSNFKNDILLEQTVNSLESQLTALGYSPDNITPLGTHRSQTYYADVLDAFTPQKQRPKSQARSHLVRQDNGRFLYVTTSELGTIQDITPLRE
jgi:hypothetical protein